MQYDVCSATINAKSALFSRFLHGFQIYLKPRFSEPLSFYADDYISIRNKSRIIIMYCFYGGSFISMIKLFLKVAMGSPSHRQRVLNDLQKIRLSRRRQDLAPTPTPSIPSPVSKQLATHRKIRKDGQLAYWRGERGWRGSQIIRWRETLVLYNHLVFSAKSPTYSSTVAQQKILN
jgi:hypothetical protein